MTSNVWDEGRWSKNKVIKFDFMTGYIYEHIIKFVKYHKKTTLELGSGTGRLSYLALLKGQSKSATLIDSSFKAFSLSNQLFHSIPKSSYNIVKTDIFDFNSSIKYDIVFSSGVIEHFKKNMRFKIIKKHIELSKHDVIIVHPSDTLYNKYFNKFPLAVKLYGFQKSFSEKEINSYLNSLSEVNDYYHKRFHFFYTFPFLHNLGFINRLLDRSILGKLFGGLTITHISVK